MKKLLLSIFTFLTVSSSYSQDDVINLLTIDGWDNLTSNWFQLAQSDYVYNNSCLLTELSGQFLDFTTGNLQNSSRSTFTFNNDNLTEIVTNQMWDNINSQWVNLTKTHFFYTGNNATESRNYQWINGAWEISGRSMLTYNSSNLVTENTVQGFDNTNTTWFNTSKTVITYNSNDLTDTSTSLTWNSSTLLWENVSRQISSYTNNILSTRQSELWANGIWENNLLETFSYDNNDFLIETLNQLWNGSIYEDNTRLSYTNDANGNQIGTITQVWITTSNLWLNSSRSTSSFSSCLVTSTEELSKINLKIYPNPVSDKLQLLTDITFEGTVSLFDTMGRRIFSRNITPTENSIDVSQFAEGLYVLLLENQDQRITKQVVIQR